MPDSVVESRCSGKLASKRLSPRILCICLFFYKDLPAQVCAERGSWWPTLIKPQQMIVLLLPILLETSTASFQFFVYKNVRNVLALNNMILSFPARMVFKYDLMGFKFSDLFLRRETTCVCWWNVASSFPLNQSLQNDLIFRGGHLKFSLVQQANIHMEYPEALTAINKVLWS